MDNFDPNAELTPDSPCPPWCVMHIGGAHIAELGEPAYENDRYTVFVRETDEGDGEVGIEVIVAAKDSRNTTRVTIDPEAVKAAAALSEAEQAATISRAIQQAMGRQSDPEQGQDEQEEPGQ